MPGEPQKPRTVTHTRLGSGGRGIVCRYGCGRSTRFNSVTAFERVGRASMRKSCIPTSEILTRSRLGKLLKLALRHSRRYLAGTLTECTKGEAAVRNREQTRRAVHSVRTSRCPKMVSRSSWGRTPNAGSLQHMSSCHKVAQKWSSYPLYWHRFLTECQWRQQ
jgi:hypothetical protein